MNNLWGGYGGAHRYRDFPEYHPVPGNDVIHVKVVLATALMAIARKVIILDYDDPEPMYIFATGVVLLATGATYFFVLKIPGKEHQEGVETRDSEQV